MTIKNLYQSAEIRWFFNGSLPSDQIDWFSSGASGVSNDERTDQYLIFPSCESIGVKIREGKLEIKTIRGGAETFQFDGISGRMDCWTKWSYSHGGFAPIFEDILSSQNLIKVDKKRQLRKFSLDTQSVMEVDPNTRPDQGCLLELTEINIYSNAWWSLGFEAFGPTERVSLNLHQVATEFFENNHLPMQLSTINSCCYPVFLNGLYNPVSA